jgi:hypothetical protein
MLNFYDFEVFKCDWLVVIINPIDQTTEIIINDKEKLSKYYEEHKNEIWIGYNCRNYDQYILKGILCDFNSKEINDYIIVKGKKGWQFSKLLRQFSLNNYDVMSKFYSLKQLEGFMGNDIRETSVPFDIDRPLTKEEIAETVKYCTHDVEQTIEVFLQRKVEFDAQMGLIKIFNLSLSNVSKTQAQLAATILNVTNQKRFDDEWQIRLPETLQLNKYKFIANWFLNPVNHDYKKSFDVNVAGVPHTFAWGGVHGAISQYIYTCKSDEIMVMADVSQLYPFLMLVYRLLSRNCPDSAYSILENTIDTSLKLKAEGKKAEREPYKRFNNIIYGAEGDSFNPMYDPLHRNLVCVFGQVLILDLIEKIESFCELIQSNTDGILIKLKRNDFEKLDDIVYEWEQRTGLMMEFDYYEKVIQKDVNNYIVVDYNGKFKSKGAYVKKLNDIDNDLPIVNEAIVNYLVYDKPVEDTIDECNELIKFQKIVKVSSKYAFATHNGQKSNDKTFRVFASKRNDSYIGKCKREGATSEKFGNTPDHCFIDNADVKNKTIPDYLDKSWYIKLAKDRLDQFGVEPR